MAVVDTLQDADVEYGEVLVYELTSDLLQNDPSTECYTATLRFTDFAGNNYTIELVIYNTRLY